LQIWLECRVKVIRVMRLVVFRVRLELHRVRTRAADVWVGDRCSGGKCRTAYTVIHTVCCLAVVTR